MDHTYILKLFKHVKMYQWALGAHNHDSLSVQFSKIKYFVSDQPNFIVNYKI